MYTYSVVSFDSLVLSSGVRARCGGSLEDFVFRLATSIQMQTIVIAMTVSRAAAEGAVIRRMNIVFALFLSVRRTGEEVIIGIKVDTVTVELVIPVNVG